MGKGGKAHRALIEQSRVILKNMGFQDAQIRQERVVMKRRRDFTTKRQGGRRRTLILVRTADNSVWTFRKHEKKRGDAE